MRREPSGTVTTESKQKAKQNKRKDEEKLE